MANELSAGKEVVSNCNKCGHATPSIIVVMRDVDKIGKVECKSCKTVQTFKDPSAKKKTRKKSTRTRKPSVSIEEQWNEAISNASGQENQTYSPKSKFNTGDVIDHATFGTGVVEKFIDSNKIEVIFKDSYKTLVHNIK